MGETLAGKKPRNYAVDFWRFFALLFPPVIPLPVTGGYAYETVSFTWTDDAREEEFCSDGSSRRVAVQFWYPVSGEGETFPLIVFSHGAFGYRMSNCLLYTSP